MLFGHQDDNNQQAVDTAATQVADDTSNPLAVDPISGASLPTVQEETHHVEPANLGANSVLDQPSLDQSPEPSQPVLSAPSLDIPSIETVEQTNSFTPDAPETVTDADSNSSATATNSHVASGSSDLLELKTQALSQLSPLISHLDQSPEEKFRTTMMLIQSTDNQDLLKAAYDAANEINDEKTRAQALLDVVNEINYFTQPKAS